MLLILCFYSSLNNPLHSKITIVKTNNLSLALLLIGFIGVFIFTCKKDKLIEDGNLLRKSFPKIEIFNDETSSSDATLYFNISDLVDNDSIKNIEIIYWLGSDPTNTFPPIEIPKDKRFIKISNLQSASQYFCRIKVITSDNVNNEFFSHTEGEGYGFNTSAFTINFESLVINELQLKTTATASIIDLPSNVVITEKWF